MTFYKPIIFKIAINNTKLEGKFQKHFYVNVVFKYTLYEKYKT